MQRRSNLRILVVDDDEKHLSALRRIMRGTFDVATTKDPLHALDIFQHKGPFAVVISDYRMPLMNGIELLSRICAMDKNTQRIMLTGHAELQMAIDAINHGKINAFLTKPISAVSIRSVVVDAIRVYNQNLSNGQLHEPGIPPQQADTENCAMLTVKEKEVLSLLAKGFSNDEISQELNITVGTVKSHVNNLFEKMDVNSRSKVVAKALEWGLIRPQAI